MIPGWFNILIGCAFLLAARVQAQPNIVLIIVDDAGIGDFSVYGPTPIHTPSLDRLAAEGMHFTRAYSGSTVCTPARSSLMTGRHLGRATVRGNSGGISLRDDDVTLAEVLQDAGYATGGFGKWGLGAPGSPGAPERQGFDTFVGPYHQVHAHRHYTDAIFESGQLRDIPENEGFVEPPFALVDPARAHTQNIFIEEMKTFATEHVQAGVPFFLYGAWNPPHFFSTIPADDPAVALYQTQPWHDETKIQAAMITMIDRHVGELLDHLDALGVGDDTLFIFTSDNGGELGTIHGDYPRNRGLRGEKGTLFEGGLRVPLIARWSGVIAPGSQSAHLTYFPDILPTLADIAGAASPVEIDGLSLAPTLSGAGQQPAHDALYFEDRAFNFSTGRYSEHLDWAVRIDDFKGLVRASGPLQLFNLATDPAETLNVASQHPQIVQQMLDVFAASHADEPPQYDVLYRASVKGAIDFGVRSSALLGLRLSNGSFESPPLDPTGPNGGVLQVGNIHGWWGGGIRHPANGVLAGNPPMFNDPIPGGEQVGWLRSASGSLSFVLQPLADRSGAPLELHLEDLHRAFRVSLWLGRRMDQSPGVEEATLRVSLCGQSGQEYLAAEVSTGAQLPGAWTHYDLTLAPPGGTPFRERLHADLGRDLTLALTHVAGIGEIFLDDVRAGFDVCYPDLDGNNLLDVFDFLAFQERFINGDPLACECDSSTGSARCDIFDFLCFADLFVAGCP